MASTAARNRQYYICPAANGGEADGSAARPFGSFEAALEAVKRALPTSGEEASQEECLELIRIDKADQLAGVAKKPRCDFYVDTHLLGAEGDGTERDPWPDFETAVSEIAKSIQSGRLRWRPGDRIRILQREMFTPTSLEQRKRFYEITAHLTFMSMAIGLVLPVIAVLGYLVYRALPALSLDFLFLNPVKNNTEGGIWAPLIGTFFLILTSLILAAPIGVLAGVYLNEYAKDNWRTRIINLAVVNLAGVPSIVHGLFGVAAFVAFAHMGKSLLAASSTLAVMTLPVIIASTKEALGAVPMSFRQACWNLGASRWQTIRTIVLPNSISGILTGVILQVARAAGETAPILYTGATISKTVADSGFDYFFPYRLDEKFLALSNHLFVLSKQNQFVDESVVFGTAVVLIALVLAFNSVAICSRLYLRSRKKW